MAPQEPTLGGPQEPTLGAPQEPTLDVQPFERTPSEAEGHGMFSGWGCPYPPKLYP